MTQNTFKGPQLFVKALQFSNFELLVAEKPQSVFLAKQKVAKAAFKNNVFSGLKMSFEILKLSS